MPVDDTTRLNTLSKDPSTLFATTPKQRLTRTRARTKAKLIHGFGSNYKVILIPGRPLGVAAIE